jgi:hypothetical protein
METDADNILANATEQYWQAQKLIDAEGGVIVDKLGRKRAHPALAWQNNLVAQIHRLLKLKGGADAEDTIDDLLATGSSD